MRSILFQLGVWGIGGVERVTVVLANEFVQRGYAVAVSFFKVNDNKLLGDLDAGVEVCNLRHGWFSNANKLVLSDLIRRRKVDFVINQWCTPYSVSRFLRAAIGNMGAKLIAVHHNDPSTNKRIQDAKNPVTKFVWRVLTSINLRMVYSASNVYVVLSPAFKKSLGRMIGRRKLDKVVALPNPLTIRCQQSNATSKEKIILYVGRLEETQKRVSRIFEIWRLFQGNHRGWSLVVVGDGPDRARYESLAKDLPGVHFTGFVDPSVWYQKGKLLLMTSDFEGFPLVLFESMSAGCVPIVLDSFASANDIVPADCGRILPVPFDSKEFVRELNALADDDSICEQMSLHSVELVNNYSPSAVADRYEEVFRNFHNDGGEIA